MKQFSNEWDSLSIIGRNYSYFLCNLEDILNFGSVRFMYSEFSGYTRDVSFIFTTQHFLQRSFDWLS